MEYSKKGMVTSCYFELRTYAFKPSGLFSTLSELFSTLKQKALPHQTLGHNRKRISNGSMDEYQSV